MLLGLESNDAELFAHASRSANGSDTEQCEAWRHLLETVGSSDAKRGELALNALRFSGLVLDANCYGQLTAVLEKIRTPGELEKLTAEDAKADKESKKAVSASVALPAERDLRIDENRQSTRSNTRRTHRE